MRFIKCFSINSNLSLSLVHVTLVKATVIRHTVLTAPRNYAFYVSKRSEQIKLKLTKGG